MLAICILALAVVSLLQWREIQRLEGRLAEVEKMLEEGVEMTIEMHVKKVLEEENQSKKSTK